MPDLSSQKRIRLYTLHAPLVFPIQVFFFESAGNTPRVHHFQASPPKKDSSCWAARFPKSNPGRGYLCTARFLKPGVLIRGGFTTRSAPASCRGHVSLPASLQNQYAAKLLHDGAVIADIAAIIVIRRFVNRAQPHTSTPAIGDSPAFQ